jgi:hypothetical protein
VGDHRNLSHLREKIHHCDYLLHMKSLREVRMSANSKMIARNDRMNMGEMVCEMMCEKTVHAMQCEVLREMLMWVRGQVTKMPRVPLRAPCCR